jgi:hypothetical protein
MDQMVEYVAGKGEIRTTYRIHRENLREETSWPTYALMKKKIKMDTPEMGSKGVD